MTDVQLTTVLLTDTTKEDEIKRIEKIEEELLCLNEIMSSIRELTIEQQPVFDLIEQNIIETSVSTSKGVEELEVAEVYQNKIRLRRIKVISGAVVGGLLFGGIGIMAFGASQAIVATGIGSGAGAFTGLLT